MDSKTYIASGILELYVYGALSAEENAEVYTYIQKYPEVKEEVARIEMALMQLSSAVSPQETESAFDKIKAQITKDDHTDTSKVIPLKKSKTPWISYIGWAAAIALLIGTYIQFNTNKELEQQLTEIEREQDVLEGKLLVAEEELVANQEILNILRDKDIIRIPLVGQTVAPEAYASVYWDQNTQQVIIDAAGLPAPPPGKVYQVWSLTLNPLTPTSMGLLEDFTNDNNKIFALENPNQSQAFGITLEPDGGSETPTLEMLYALGALSS